MKLVQLLRHVAQTESCWLWLGAKDRNGYGRVSRKSYGESLAHRAIYVCMNGAIPEDLYLLHKCDNPTCVKPAHMEPGTQQDNLKQAQDRGRSLGMRAKKVQLTDITTMRELLGAGFSQREIAAQYGISQSYLSQILSNQRRTK